MEMCRFTGLDDVEYKKVAAVLNRITATFSKQPTRREPHALSDDQRRKLIDSLRFDQMDARQMSIKTAYAKTCKWLLQRPEYVDWLNTKKLNEHHGFLWIKGKPGTGKSTLMKFALASSRKSMTDRVVISFFFNARGADLEKSTIGMYRSLLLQLLGRLPKLQSIFESLEFTSWNSDYHHLWSIESLKDLFGRAIQLLEQSSVACFIDALDECDEYQIRDMVAFFQRLGDLAVSAKAQFQVLFSSRHYPHITITKGLDLTLEGQEGHNQDIATYVDSELRIGHSGLAERIRVNLQEKASGVFMWVVLVVDILNKEHDEGRTARRLLQKLNDIPDDLHKLFRDLLTRDCRNRDELLLCIQWVLFAREPLKPEQLYFAILSGTEPEDLSNWNADNTSIDTIKRFILNSSKGLAEITKSKIPTVQFIHESVRDFFLKENGLREVWSDFGSNFQGESHQRLTQCCRQYINADVVVNTSIPDPLPTASSEKAAVLRQEIGTSFPFLEYAVQNILYHAEAAEASGVSQKDFIKSFQRTIWLKLHDLFEKFQARRHSPEPSLMYILAESNMPALIRTLSSNKSCFEVGNERYGTPIFAAMATQSHEAVQALLGVQAEAQPLTSPLHSLLKHYENERCQVTNFRREFTFSRRRSALSYLAEHGDEVTTTFLLATAKVEADKKDKSGRTPLSWAAGNGHEAIAKLLLATGQVEINSKDENGETPLSWAAKNGHEAIVKLLLLATSQVEVNSKDKSGRTPLSLAAKNRQKAVVELLLATGQVKINWKDESGWTPLSRAAGNGDEAVVKLLLATGQVKIDSKTKIGQTPLSLAAVNNYEAIVELLLATGQIEINSKDENGLTPLSYAAAYGRKGSEAIVKLLLATGQVEVKSKDKSGRTPLSWAAGNGHKAIVELLLATGQIEIDSKDENGWTPLSLAAGNGHEAIVKLLLATGHVEIDSKDESGQTPLSWAARNGHEAIVELLLATGQIEIDSKDENDRTPLSYAAAYADKGGKAIVKLLLATGQVEVNSKDKSGRTPLSRAAKNGHKAIVKLLLAAGHVEIDSKDGNGWTPLSWAARNGHKAIVKLLLATGHVEIESKDESGQTPLLWAAKNGHEAIIKLLLAADLSEF
jgi:ankyrin repeat protein